VLARPNALQWDGGPGHYEVYYLTLTDPATGVGVWIRYTMVAPLAETQTPATAALWLLAMDPRNGGETLARKATLPVAELRAEADPFRLWIGDASLSEQGMAGAIDDVAWDLRWEPCPRAYEHVDGLLRRSGLAKTVLVLPQADLRIRGTVRLPHGELALDGARGGQAHLWGSKHASSWAWVHCNDFTTPEGEPVSDAFVDAVSVLVPRLRREVGPSTPVLGRVEGRDFQSTSPLRVLANESTFTLTGWRFEAVDVGRRLVGEVDATREQMVGVTYHDPDGELAYCYNSETASMRLHLFERARQVGGWAHRRTLVARGRAHFEFGARTPVPGIELLIR
jgi:hypothetical protein